MQFQSISFELIHETMKKTFPQLTEVQADILAKRLTLHLLEYEKTMIFEQSEIEMINQMLAMAKTDAEMQKKIIELYNKRFSELPQATQQTVKQSLMNELVKQGHNLFIAMNDGRS
jgi:uncharacterized protein (DUF3084 family)